MAMLHDFGLHLAGPQTAERVRELDLGRVAIMALFVLSGLNAMTALKQHRHGGPWRFAAARMLDLLPPFLVAVLLSWGVQSLMAASGMARPLQGHLMDPGDLDLKCLLLNLVAVVPGATMLNLNPDDVLVPYVAARLSLAVVLSAVLAMGADGTVPRVGRF
jgi:hypothetical protein